MYAIRRTVLLAAVLVACSRAPGVEVQPADAVARIRAATRPFQSIDSAAARGYARNVRDCLVHEHHGAMGFHHVNRGYSDARFELERPEILLYERTDAGTYQLNGVEYIIPFSAWPRDSVAPVALGQRMRRDDNLRIWFLHVWAWKDNPDGVFADYHPGVRCPPDARKVFMTFERPGS
jgi:hypothetical protein